MAFSVAFKNRLLTWVLRPGESVTRPTVLHAALFSAVTGPETGTEVTGFGYTRCEVTTAFAAPTGGVLSNGAAIIWPSGPVGGDWTVAGIALYDAASGGVLVTEIQEVSPPEVVLDGSGAPGFEIGQLAASLDACP